MHLAAMAVLAVIGLWWFTRSRELFHVSVRAGRVLVVRGRVPPGLLASFREIVDGTAVRGSIRVLKQEHGARLVCSGNIDAGTVQRMRNVFALCPASKLRQAPAIARPTIGQVTGIASLAWLFEGALRRR